MYYTFNGAGSFEVFHAQDYPDAVDSVSGWYWWACFPGCLPDSEEPEGPFDSIDEAIGHALFLGPDKAGYLDGMVG